MNEIKPVENLNKNLESFVEISPKQKEDNPLQRNCHNQLSHVSLSKIEQECQESFIQGKIHIQQNLN